MVTTDRLLLVSSGQRSGMLLNIPPCSATSYNSIVWPQMSMMLRMRSPALD